MANVSARFVVRIPHDEVFELEICPAGPQTIRSYGQGCIAFEGQESTKGFNGWPTFKISRCSSSTRVSLTPAAGTMAVKHPDVYSELSDVVSHFH